MDTETGEILHRKLTPDRTKILNWIGSLPGPVRVVHEAGPAGDRVKTDTRVALHLARLLKLGEITGGQAWTGVYEIWLNQQHFAEPARELTYRSCLAGMQAIDERRQDLDAAITNMALDR